VTQFGSYSISLLSWNRACLKLSLDLMVEVFKHRLSGYSVCGGAFLMENFPESQQKIIPVPFMTLSGSVK
jgi:hypothetical protein